MTEPTYIPLRLHTEFSITDGMVRIKKLIAKAQEYGLPALGSDNTVILKPVRQHRNLKTRPTTP
ncbi:DNA polymerase III subunit alpha [Neisseria meningitidis]|nr:PHP domain-containing protein [Neisseria meningitidis]CEZ50629.1 DNA polymerase III subunit alpha [Neisseria meningitidis]